jgi:hypothetical protein
MILFLDFDGVLHPLFTRPELPPEESRPFCYLPRFAAVLRDYPSVEIVISSTWRLKRDLEQLREPFPHDLRPRVIDTTPHLFDDERFGARQREALHWLALHRPGSPWIALDDLCTCWPAVDRLVWCDDGFREREETELRRRLGEPEQ